MKIETFKVQRALVGAPSILIYNESRTIESMIFPNDDKNKETYDSILNLFEEDEFKIYVKGYITKDGTLHLEELSDEYF